MTHEPSTREPVPPDGTISDDAEQAVAKIAQHHLRLDTLEARNSDALDFHELAVWSIRDALLAAYAAGASTVTARREG